MKTITILTKEKLVTELKKNLSSFDDIEVVSPQDFELSKYHDDRERLDAIVKGKTEGKHYYILHDSDIFGQNHIPGKVGSYCDNNRIVYTFNHKPLNRIYQILFRDLPFNDDSKQELIKLLENA